MNGNQFILKLLFFLLMALVGNANAAEYPTKPIRFVVPFTPGAGLDSIARLISPRLSGRLGQRIVVDNRPSASGILGTEIAAKAPPDGYTIAIGNVGTHAANVSLFKTLPYDPAKDFIPITQIARVSELMLVHPSLPVNSVKEFIALAKAKPGQLTFGSSGQGTTPHLAAVLFQTMAGIHLVHVPYKGIAPAIVDLIAGQTNTVFSNILSALPHVRSGRLRALGVTSAERSPVAPDIPAIAETVPGYQEYNWYGIFVPAGTPRKIVKILNMEIVRVLHMPEVGDRLTKGGAEVVASTPDEFARFVQKEREKYARVFKESGIRPE